MGQIECFWIEPTRSYRRQLRRYSSHPTVDGSVPVEFRCPKDPGKYSYHTTFSAMDVIEADEYPTSGDLWPHDDARWPKNCECGYAYQEGDQWQLFIDQLYQKATGERMALRDAPPGAMWDAYWLREYQKDWVGPDGLCVILKTPGGEWAVDGPSSSGGRWTRTGTSPKFTAMPSILIPNRYHGWFRDGFLIEC